MKSVRGEWQKRGVYDDPRLTEMSNLYESLGFEIRFEPFKPEREDGCRECMKENADRYKVLYTKKIIPEK